MKQNRYEVWRYHVLQGTFTFQELKKWLLANLSSEYHEEIKKAQRATRRNYYSRHGAPLSLDWIATNSEHCAIKKVTV